MLFSRCGDGGERTIAESTDKIELFHNNDTVKAFPGYLIVYSYSDYIYIFFSFFFCFFIVTVTIAVLIS